MKEANVILINATGLHARPASMFVKEASSYACDVTVEKDGTEYNAKSIMGILSMGAMKGDEIIVRANGEGEEAAVKALAALIETGFGE